MPKHRRKNISHIKQRKAIATRLIQISFIIDDYVYKNKGISEHDAQTYLLEVSSFKNKCNGDPRSLQVIEKLTLFMRAIIKEHREKQENISIISNTKEISTQVTCEPIIPALIDVDKDFNQATPKEKNVNLMEVDDCAGVDLSQDSDDKHNEEVNTITEYNDGEKSLIHLGEIESVDEEIFAATPNLHSESVLSFYQEMQSQDLFEAYTQDENRFHDVGPFKNPNEPITQNEHLTNTSPQKSEIFTETDNSQSILSNFSYIAKDSQSLITPTEMLSNSKDKLNVPKTIEKKVVTNSLPVAKVNYQMAPSLCKESEKKSKKEHQAVLNSTFNNISNLQLHNLDTPVLKPIKNFSKVNEKTKTKKAPRKKKINVPSDEKPKIKEVARKYKKRDLTKSNFDKNNKMKSNITSTNAICNENSVDLSWVESLKYIREISTPENHTRHKDLSDSFWENYSLPCDWDNTEFSYSV